MKNSKKELIKKYPETYDPKKYPVSFRQLEDGKCREYRHGKPTNNYFRKVKYKGKIQLIPEEIMLHIDEWKILQKRSRNLDERYEKTKKLRAGNMWTTYDPHRLLENKNKVTRKMSKHQIAVEKSGYDFHALV